MTAFLPQVMNFRIQPTDHQEITINCLHDGCNWESEWFCNWNDARNGGASLGNVVDDAVAHWDVNHRHEGE